MIWKIKSIFIQLINTMISPFDVLLIPVQAKNKAKRIINRMSFPKLKKGSSAYIDQILRHINRWERRKVEIQIPTSMWRVKKLYKRLNLPHFRSDNQYIYQTRDNNTPDSTVLTYKYVANNDKLCVLVRSKETGEFGSEIVRIPTYGLVSRDLLDSANELNFLENVIGLSKIVNLTIFDIGAGYGRLAVHSIATLENIEKHVCLDAVPGSLGICEFYLKYKQLNPEKYHISFLPEDYLPPKNSIAVAIHSFSEMPLESVLYWIEFLKKMEVDWILIVPNREKHKGKKLLATEVNGSRTDYSGMLLKNGYENYGIFPKYNDPDIQEFGISPTMYHLYKKSIKKSL